VRVVGTPFRGARSIHPVASLLRLKLDYPTVARRLLRTRGGATNRTPARLTKRALERLGALLLY
jgi:hypothetical protein